MNVDRLPAGGRHFVARQAELCRLDEAWNEDKIAAISIVGRGGVGKSALVDEWLQTLRADGWRGARRVYGWSFDGQGTEERLTSADGLIHDALSWFGDPDPSAGSARDRGQRLADLVREKRTLLVLDGVEPLQYPSGSLDGRLKDPALAMLIQSLTKSNAGLLVISTQEPIKGIAGLEDASAPRLDLETLSDDDGAELLELLGVQGTRTERRAASADFQGHALALSLLGTYLVQARGGEIRQLQETELDSGDEVVQGGPAWRVIEAWKDWLGKREVSLLRVLGLFDRPVEPKALATLCAGPSVKGLNDGLVGLEDRAFNAVLMQLGDAGLIAQKSGSYLDVHPLIRAYFRHQLEYPQPAAWQAGNERLYKHYKSVAPYHPDTLEEMMPLYAAVVHGCRAGKHKPAHDEVYRPRICRGSEHYQIHKLGAFGADLVALGSFFVRPWVEVAAGFPKGRAAWLLEAAGFELRTVGRLTEAVQSTESGLALYKERSEWKRAAVAATNVCYLSLTVGDVARALTSSEESVLFADKSGNDFQQLSTRATLADALHQAGRWDASIKIFREVEAKQAEREPSSPRLYSRRGYQFCDLLLGRPGPQVWSGLKESIVGDGDVQRLREACEEVVDRARYAMELAQRNQWILDLAHDHLSLGRAHFGRALCGYHGAGGLAKQHLNRAVEEFRASGYENFLPRGLLARAAYRRVYDERSSVEADLDEAEVLAERGPMLLFLADVYLERTLLHRTYGENDEARRRLDAAKELIERCGYERRRPDAEILEEVLMAAHDTPAPTSRAPRPSFATLPKLRTPPATLFDYLDARFPQVGGSTWARRFARGLVTDDDGAALEPDTPYQPGLRIRYFREVEQEPRIPFTEEIIFHNDRLLVADKPHFLPVVPSGLYVNECLLYRLQRSTGLEHLTPLHRLDRPAAGLVMFSTDPTSRGDYHRLFDEHQLHREYRAVAVAPRPPERRAWRIESRLVRGEPWFRMGTVDGAPNAVTRVVLEDWRDGRAYLRLYPESGKKHQLRVHLAEIGLPIEGDRLYPRLLPQAPPDFDQPLRLLAQRLRFNDPLTGEEIDLRSRQSLSSSS